MNAIIKLESAGLCYKKRESFFKSKQTWAIRNLSLEVKKGETLGVLGRNGAGKSTLLRVLSGILDLDEGKIQRNAMSASLLTLNLGFLPNLNGRDNALLSGMLLGKTKTEMQRLLDEIVDFSEIGDAIDDPVRTYSTGMRARLSFATALKADPEVVLIDELLGVGDRSFQRKSSEAMKEKISSDKTVVLVSHNDALIREVCDRLIWIEGGIIRAEGSVDNVREKYLESFK